MGAKSIERIAEELGVNFYDLCPLIQARDEWHLNQGRKEVVKWVEKQAHQDCYLSIDFTSKEWQFQKKEWGL